MKRRIALAALAVAGLLAIALPLAAQTPSGNWPEKPIRFVMAAPPGSSIDVLGRTIADKLKDRLGQPVIVENKPAAGGTVATAEVAKAAPDGYTMLLAFNGPLAFGPLLQKLPYDPQKDLATVIVTTSQPNVLAVNAQLPVKSVAELVAYAKANPKFGASGPRSGPEALMCSAGWSDFWSAQCSHVDDLTSLGFRLICSHAY
jgi:tripartite-type tricarboxylate transporter receptor subunit TctC